MKTHLPCPCGELIVARDEDELIELVLGHLADQHPHLSYDREQILFLAY